MDGFLGFLLSLLPLPWGRRRPCWLLGHCWRRVAPRRWDLDPWLRRGDAPWVSRPGEGVLRLAFVPVELRRCRACEAEGVYVGPLRRVLSMRDYQYWHDHPGDPEACRLIGPTYRPQ